jgi:hypothetical protein
VSSATWKGLDLAGAAAIAEVVGTYVITTLKLPGTTFRIEVQERGADFIAYPNFGVRVEGGAVDTICGIGSSEMDALQDALTRVMEIVNTRAEWGDGEVEWT